MPKIYDVLRQNPRFYEWNEEVFLRSVPLENFDVSEVNQALEIAKQRYEQDFVEDWQEVLFRIVWTNKWQRSRILDATQLLSIIKNEILYELPSSEDTTPEQFIIEAMKLTTVTAVSATDRSAMYLSPEQEEEGNDAAEVVQYWNDFSNEMAGTGCVFDYALSSTRSMQSISKKSKIAHPESLRFHTRTKSDWAVKITSSGVSQNFETKLFETIRSRRSSFEQEFGVTLRVKISESGGGHTAYLTIPGATNRLKSENGSSDSERKLYFKWLRDNAIKLERYLAAIENDGDEAEGQSLGF